MDLFGSGDAFAFEEDIGDMDAFFGAGSNAHLSGNGGSVYRGTTPSSPRKGPFVGLLNQGATCYLNSLIVSLYMTPEIRSGMYSLSAEDMVVPLDGTGPTEVGEGGAENALAAEVDPEAMAALLGMGFLEDQIRRAIRKHPYDPDNMQRVEYILGGDLSEEDVEVASKPEAPTTKERRIPKELQRLFARMQAADSNSGQSTKPLTDCFGSNFSGGVQHDVHELNRLLFDRIEKQLRGTAIQDLINDLYRGTTVNRIVCKSCGYKSEREESYLDLSLIVGDLRDVEESLANSVTDELLEGDNQYECSGCKQKVDALKGLRVRTVPPVLILSLSRFEYDKQTWQRIKNLKRFPFPSVLDMAPYMENEGKESVIYDLFGVVIHRGEQASFGHYHAYIQDVVGEAEQGGWFDFNDSSVTKIETETIEKQFGGIKASSECAYMLIYRKRESAVLSQQIRPVVPAHLLADIEAENESNRVQRTEWEEMKNKIEIVLHTPLILEQGPNDLIRLRNDKGKQEDNDDEEDACDDHLPDLTQPQKLLIDRNRTLGELKSEALKLFGAAADGVLPSNPSNLQIHRIRILDDRSQRVKFLRPLDRPLARDGKEIEYDDSAILDSLSTVTHGCNVLVWDGVQLFDGEPFEVCYDLITICVTFYDAMDTSRSFDIVVKEGALLRDLALLIAQHEQVPDTEELLLCRVDYGKLTKLLEPEKSLREMYLNDHVSVSAEKVSSLLLIEANVETGAPARQESRAAAAMRGLDEQVEIFVTNNCDATFLQDSVTCKMAMTVWDLKQAIVEKIGTLNERVAMRLRRMTAGGGEGQLFPDEGSSLKKAGIETNMRVIIEYGEPPDAANLTVKYTWGTVSGQKILSELQSVCVPRTMDIGALKRRIMETLALQNSPDLYRLRRTDYWSSQKEIFSDEKQTLKTLAFQDCDCVWIEEGAVPPKGMLELHLDLQTSRWSETTKEGAAMVPGGDPAEIWNGVNISVIQVSRASTLAALRKEIASNEAFRQLLGARGFRLWYKGKLLRGEDRTLKKLGVASSGTISVQALPESIEEHADLAGDGGRGVLFFARKRNVGTKSFDSPEECVIVKDAQSNFVSKAALLNLLYSQASIEPEPLLVLRYVSQSSRWRVIIDPADDAESIEMMPLGVKEGTGSGNQSGKRKKADDIFLTDGDLIVWKRTTDGEDNFMSAMNQQYPGTYQSTSSRSQVRTQPRAKEIGLNISDDGW